MEQVHEEVEPVVEPVPETNDDSVMEDPKEKNSYFRKIERSSERTYSKTKHIGFVYENY